MGHILDNPDLESADSVLNLTLVRESLANPEAQYVRTSDSYTLAIVRPTEVRKLEKHEVKIYEGFSTPAALLYVLRRLEPLETERKLYALDLETNMVDCLHPSAKIAGIGLTTSIGTAYFHTLGWSEPMMQAMYEWLATPDGREYIGHNVMFDGSWLRKMMGGYYLPWAYDTLALYRQLANEGYPVQQGGAYGLKDAQMDLLSWDAKGDVELAEWLVVNGYYKGNAKEGLTKEELRQRFREKKLRPDKSKMSNAPADILGYYCGLDTYSTYHLLVSVFEPSVKVHTWADAFWSYHHLFMNNLYALIEQYLRGIRIDEPKMRAYLETLEGRVEGARRDFLQHPKISPHIERYRALKRTEYAKQEPSKFKALPKMGEEPAKHTKSGSLSKNWVKWAQKKAMLDSGLFTEIAQTWLDWRVKMDKMERDELFNLDSGPMRQWLFYGEEQLGFPVKARTEKGNPETGKKALVGWGEFGQMLKLYNDLNKEAQMVRSTLAVLNNGRLHPQFKAPGTLTGRLAGGGTETEDGEGRFNIQQIPKRKEYLECWIPDEGYVFVDCDHSALEQVVLAALSNDPALMSVYGPAAPGHQDIYLFVGSNLPGLGEKIRAIGYLPEAPTKEAIDRAKKECKKERDIAKVITLGSSYGMGPKKMRLTLDLAGIQISEDEAFGLWSAYWDLFSGVRKYNKSLERQWSGKGWVLNGLGRPVCCAESTLKDLGNRVIQSSGHDAHMVFIEELLALREETGLDMQGIIWDFHDQSIVQVPIADAERMCIVYKEAYVRMNRRIKEMNPNFRLDIKGEPAVVINLAKAKGM